MKWHVVFYVHVTYRVSSCWKMARRTDQSFRPMSIVFLWKVWSSETKSSCSSWHWQATRQPTANLTNVTAHVALYYNTRGVLPCRRRKSSVKAIVIFSWALTAVWLFLCSFFSADLIVWIVLCVQSTGLQRLKWYWQIKLTRRVGRLVRSPLASWLQLVWWCGNPSVLWRCWLADRKAIRPVNNLAPAISRTSFCGPRTWSKPRKIGWLVVVPASVVAATAEFKTRQYSTFVQQCSLKGPHTMAALLFQEVINAGPILFTSDRWSPSVTVL